jgi:hypothetical protein
LRTSTTWPTVFLSLNPLSKFSLEQNYSWNFTCLYIDTIGHIYNLKLTISKLISWPLPPLPRVSHIH